MCITFHRERQRATLKKTVLVNSEKHKGYSAISTVMGERQWRYNETN